MLGRELYISPRSYALRPMSESGTRHQRGVHLLMAATTLALMVVAFRYDLGFWWVLIIPVYATVFFGLVVWAHFANSSE